MKLGGYNSVNYYASAHMWQLQSQKVHFGAYLALPRPWPLIFWPKIWRIHLCPIVRKRWKFGQILSTNVQDILLTMFIRDAHMHGCMNTLET